MNEEKVLKLRGRKAYWGPAPEGGGGGPIDPKRLPEGYPYKEMGEVVIEWDGNTDGLDNMGVYYKVSDAVYDDLSGAKVTVSGYEDNDLFDLTLAPKATQQGVDMYLVADEDIIYDQFASTGPVVVAPQGNGMGLQPGTYLFGDPTVYVAKLTSITEIIHPISEEYIQLTSPNGTKYKLTVSDDGTLYAVAVS